jgi:hypothetical protein
MVGAVVEEEEAVALEAVALEAVALEVAALEVAAPEVAVPEAVALEVAVPEEAAVVAEAREVAEAEVVAAPIYRQPRSAMSTTRSKVGIIPSLSALPAGYCRMIAILKGDG